MVTSTYDQDFFILFIISFPILCLICHLNGVKPILNNIKNIIVIVSSISLFFWIAGPIMNIIKPTNMFTIDWGEAQNVNSYFNLFFSTQKAGIFGIIIERNSSIFCEAPMFGILTTVALNLEMYNSNKFNIKTIILILTTLTTISTISIIFCVLSCIYYYLRNSKENIGKFLKLFKILSIPLIIALSCITINYLIQNKQKSISYSLRMDDYVATYKAWKKHPIFGNGFKNSDSIKIYMSAYRNDNYGLSNSIGALLYQDGIYLFLLYLVGLIKVII